MTIETPKGLTALQYAAHILEEHLGWPAKGNIELMADCLTAISKSKKLPLDKAHGYMVRAIKLAREQCIEVDRMFFMNGAYITIRPQRPVTSTHQRIDWEATRREQATPEYQALVAEFRKKLAEIAGKVEMK